MSVRGVRGGADTPKTLETCLGYTLLRQAGCDFIGGEARGRDVSFVGPLYLNRSLYAALQPVWRKTWSRKVGYIPPLWARPRGL